MDTINADSMTVEELRAILAKKEKAENEKALRERKKYEEFIEKNTSEMVEKAILVSGSLLAFHAECTEKLGRVREMLSNYGRIRGNSKGGFHLKTGDGRYRLVYRYTTLCDWDERADKAEMLLREFLLDVVRKRDRELFELIISLLERNKEGKLEYSRMQALYSKETAFTDPRWREALRLFRESFRAVDSKMRLEFYRRDGESGKWELIPLNLSSF